MIRLSRHRTRDFSLVEVIVALGVLTLLLLALAGCLVNSVTLNSVMQEQRSAVSLAEGAMNYVLANKDFRGTYADSNGDPYAKTTDATNVWQLPFSSLRDLEFQEMDEFTGDLAIKPYAYDGTNSPPTSVSAVTDWLAADCFEVVITVTWTPTTAKRAGEATTRTVTLKTYYFPQTSS